MRKPPLAIAALAVISAAAVAPAAEGEVFFRDPGNVEVRIYDSQNGAQVLPAPGVPSFRTSATGNPQCPPTGWYQFVVGLDGHSGNLPYPWYALLSKDKWYTIVFVGHGRIYFRSPLNLPPTNIDATYDVWTGSGPALCDGPALYQVLDWPSADYSPVVTITGPDQLGYKKAGTFTAQAAGGSFAASSYQYEWRYRLAGQTVWSSIAGTGPTYTRTMLNQDFDLQVKIKNPTDTIGTPPIVFETVDEHHVAYGGTP